MENIVEIPMGSLVGLCIGIAVVGILVGRSTKVMRKFATAHTRAHGGAASVDANLRTGDQSVNVLVDAHGTHPAHDGRYVVSEPVRVEREAVGYDERLRLLGGPVPAAEWQPQDLARELEREDEAARLER